MQEKPKSFLFALIGELIALPGALVGLVAGIIGISALVIFNADNHSRNDTLARFCHGLSILSNIAFWGYWAAIMILKLLI